jgi:hypothetical protein
MKEVPWAGREFLSPIVTEVEISQGIADWQTHASLFRRHEVGGMAPATFRKRDNRFSYNNSSLTKN